MNTCPSVIKCTLIDIPDRTPFTARLFGTQFPLKIEPFIFHIASTQALNYCGGYWDFFKLSNGSFYMAPVADERFLMSCPNYYRGELSGDALGIVSSLCTYSLLSFGGEMPFARTCARHFHLLREYAGEHPEAPEIFRAID